MHLSEKRKTFCMLFVAFSECTLNFEHFQKKMSLLAIDTSEINDFE